MDHSRPRSVSCLVTLLSLAVVVVVAPAAAADRAHLEDSAVQEVLAMVEAEVAPGNYSVAVGFALTTVDGRADDEWRKDTREFYVTRGVRAIDEAIEGGAPEGNPPATCELADGKTCRIVATLHKKAPTPLGGMPQYSVTYRVEVQ